MKTAPSATEATPKATRKKAKRVVALLIALPILNILSIGPVAKLVDTFPVLVPPLEPVATFVYYPLSETAKQYDPVGRFLWWYVFDVWRCTPPQLR
jgi:hypothetical protein